MTMNLAVWGAALGCLLLGLIALCGQFELRWFPRFVAVAVRLSLVVAATVGVLLATQPGIVVPWGTWLRALAEQLQPQLVQVPPSGLWFLGLLGLTLILSAFYSAGKQRAEWDTRRRRRKSTAGMLAGAPTRWTGFAPPKIPQGDELSRAVTAIRRAANSREAMTPPVKRTVGEILGD